MPAAGAVARFVGGRGDHTSLSLFARP